MPELSFKKIHNNEFLLATKKARAPCSAFHNYKVTHALTGDELSVHAGKKENQKLRPDNKRVPCERKYIIAVERDL